MEKLLEKVENNASKHASIPFWSWNDRLEHEELVRQIRDMASLGMKGFFMHARSGLETPYMSEEWFDAIRACVDESKALGMEAWAYDENGWPSGFAGGILLEDPKNHACGLVCEQVDSFPAADEDILGVYAVSDREARRIFEPCDAKNYTVIKRKRDFSYVDTMNPDITKQYLRLTHERYKKEIGDEFGKTMPGFFTDEPQYFRYGTPWSDTFIHSFVERFGYDVLDALPALFFDFDGALEYRYDYYLHCHTSFYDGFMAQVYDWCDKNGVMLTGHGIEEWGLGGQMMCCGGIMPFYLYEHIPGIDYLGRNVRDISGARQLGSVCEQVGKELRLSEMFAGCGWDVSPKELKRIAELQFCGGVNLICEHLYPYSERGQRKRDFPCHFSEHNPWHKYYSQFETYFKNLGAVLSEGKEIADTLMIHPIRTAYLYYKRFDEGSVTELEEKYSDVVNRFAFDQIPYHFGDETVMRQLASVEGDKIRIGNCVYDKVVIPYCETLDSNTVALLREYLENGGKLCLLYDTPKRIDGKIADLSFLKSNMTYEELRALSGIKITSGGRGVPLHTQMRLTEHGRVIFVANTSEKIYNDVEITVSDCKGLVGVNVHTLQKFALRGKSNTDGSVTVLYDFGDSESCVLIESDEEMSAFEYSNPRPEISLNSVFMLDKCPENMMILDKACLSRDGEKFSDERPVVRIKDNLLRERYSGSVTMRYSFVIKDIPENIRLVAEPMRYTDLSVNGKRIEFNGEWRIDRRFRVADISGAVRNGQNTVDITFDYYQSERVYTVLYGGGNEALRNCLAFDTEIEPIYLFGSFDVRTEKPFEECERNTLRSRGNFVLCKRSKEIDLTNIVTDGYPFYCGDITAVTELQYKKGDPTYLKLGGRFAACEVTLNGKSLGTNIFDDGYELEEELVEGKNTLKIKLCVSNRNLLGPHHRHDPEPTWVVPRLFSFEKAWIDDRCDDFEPKYSFVKFGINF